MTERDAWSAAPGSRQDSAPLRTRRLDGSPELVVHVLASEVDRLRAAGGGELFGWVHEGGTTLGMASQGGLPVGWAGPQATPSVPPQLGHVWLTLDANPRAMRGDGADFRPVPVVLCDAGSGYFQRISGLVNIAELAERRVVYVGLGSWGIPIATALAQTGVGRHLLFDPELVEAVNCARGFSWADVGRPKVAVAAERMRRVNPGLAEPGRVVPIMVDALLREARLAAAIARADLVVVTADRLSVRLMVAHYACALGTCAVFGGSYDHAAAHEVIFYVPEYTPCIRCLHPDAASHPVGHGDIPYAGADASEWVAGLGIDVTQGAALAASVCLGLLEGRGSRLEALHPDCSRILLHSGTRPQGRFAQEFADPFEVRFVGPNERDPHCPLCGAGDRAEFWRQRIREEAQEDYARIEDAASEGGREVTPWDL